MRKLNPYLFILIQALLATGCTHIIVNQSVELIPREIIFGNPVKAAPQLSPDGRHCAYLAPLNGVMNIWVRTLGMKDDRAITSDTHRGIYGFQWRFDSRYILYGQDTDGDENTRLYQVDIDSHETKCFTPWPGIRSGLLALDWRKPEEALIIHNERDRRLMDVFHLDLFSGKLTTDTLNGGNIVSWSVDQNLQVRGASVTRLDAGTDIYLRSSPSSEFKLWQRWGPDDAEGGIAGFSPAGNIVYLHSSVDADAGRLLAVDLATSASRVLAGEPHIDISAILKNPRTQTPEAVQFFAERRIWKALLPGLEKDFEQLRGIHRGDFNIVSQSLDNKRWIVQYVVDDGPHSYYVYDRTAKRAEFLFEDRPALKNYALAKMQPVKFTARDGLELNGYLTLPPSAGEHPVAPLPLLEVHGGPWSRDLWGYNPSTQWLANRGYAVLKINFRGSSGYGKRFLNAGDREWGAKMLDDLIDGKRWAVAQGIADPARTAIMGGSYGGYAALAGLAFTPDEFACGVSAVGPSSLITLLKTIPPYWEPEKAVFFRRVGRLEEEDFLKSRSPLYSADKIKAPLLIGQGANDPRVKQAESDQIVQAIKARGGQIEYLLFPDEGHGFLRPENRIKYYAAAEEFLAKHLGGRVEPAAASANP